MSQKYFSMFLLVCVLLTACAAQPVIAPTSTAMPLATATLPPTSTVAPTETPIPSPTATATPQPLPAELEGFAKELEATDYRLAWSKDKTSVVLIDKATGAAVPEFQIDPKTAEWSRTYIFDNPSGEPEELTVHGKISETNKDLNFSGWKIENGEWVREKVVYEGKETDISLYSIEETMQMLRATTLEYSAAELGDNSPARKESESRMRRILGHYAKKSMHIDYNGTSFIVSQPQTGDNYKFWYNSKIYSATGNKEATIFYTWTALGKNGELGFVAWQDKKGNFHQTFVDYPEINDGYTLNRFEFTNPFIIH